MKRVVIIGGGFTGAMVAKNLERDFNVILIDTKEYFEFTPGVLRVLVEPEHVKRIQACHKDYLKRAKIMVAKVREVNLKNVKVGEEDIKFDYLVVASGSSYSAPIKHTTAIVASRASVLEEHANQLKRAKEILIVGGGLVGTELAAEICTCFPEKKITVVHAKEKLIERNNWKTISFVQDFLRRRGVRMVFNERVMSQQGKIFVTDKKTRIKADMAFMCTGIVTNYEFMKKHFSPIINKNNMIKANSHLMVDGCSNIFTGGDITDIKEEKTAQSAEDHAEIIVKNIWHCEHREPLESYEPRNKPMIISLGKWSGIFEYGSFVLSGVIPAIMKSFVEWKTMLKYRS